MRAIITALLLAGLSGVPCMSTPAAPPPAFLRCEGAEHRQFDFWLGEWDVYGGAQGEQLLGHNRIERSANGCWLVEHWQGASGNHGTSTNAWDAAYRVWRQFWVGGDGVVLRLEGGREGEAMVLAGELPDGKGGTQRQRIRWTPQADGSVVQHWETSDDAGASWQSSFRGVYRRRAAATP
ncbi:hypothetical protein [Lysobacter solisilvae (ex Woo and Kim 2020)]|uniref:DUF1579 domain-containing protein n=1 Tax=Agrilutibacter terrestris TaxID=2865112 RepID=A0A7H0G0X7_9GAMM|nr:hypothetical protein [Lysobacter terrestris]QNP41943.1 hypothetical protein H8B22_07045 [Lysobacter terrestris]